MAKTPQQVAEKWRNNLSNSTTAITDGVNGVNEAPGVAAARQKTFWLSQVQKNADKWATNVAAVPLDEWKRSMIQLGIPRIATGATEKVGKVERFMVDFLPYVESGAQRIRNMPKGGEANAIARAAAMIQHNMKFQRSGR